MRPPILGIDNLPDMVGDNFIDIEVERLLARIENRLYKLLELTPDSGEWLIVVTLEEFHAIQYWGKIYTKGPVRVPIFSSLIGKLKSRPIAGMSVFGQPVIGSDNVGELSPLIL